MVEFVCFALLLPFACVRVKRLLACCVDESIDRAGTFEKIRTDENKQSRIISSKKVLYPFIVHTTTSSSSTSYEAGFFLWVLTGLIRIHSCSFIPRSMPEVLAHHQVGPGERSAQQVQYYIHIVTSTAAATQYSSIWSRLFTTGSRSTFEYINQRYSSAVHAVEVETVSVDIERLQRNPPVVGFTVLLIVTACCVLQQYCSTCCTTTYKYIFE